MQWKEEQIFENKILALTESKFRHAAMNENNQTKNKPSWIERRK